MMMAWKFVSTARSGGASSWVVQMERKLADADPSLERARWNKPSIYRVPEWLKNKTNREAYRPLLVSLGPFHHGEPDLLPMEEHKLRAVLHIVKRSRRPLREFVAAIEEVADELLDVYHNLDAKWRGERRGQFVEMMVVDGCFLLELVKGVFRDYAPNDPVFSNHAMLYLWEGIQADMLVIENQLPLLALYRLQQVWRDATTDQPREIDVNKLVLHFIWDPLNEGKGEGTVEDILSLHPLDIYHKNFCGLAPAPQGSLKFERSMRCAVELQEKGIHFRKCNNTDVIDFKHGVLSLPEVSVGDGTEKIFLNLMAFERLHSGMRSDATAYLIFMDDIINSERDVALLRSKGIIKQSSCSDKETANLFNILSKGAVMSPYSRLHDVRRKVNDHCMKRWNKWLAIFRHTYASNPWVFISLVAAIILLIATVLQTVYSVMQFYTKS